MAKTVPLNTVNPAGSSDPKLGDDYIRYQAQATAELIAVDHWMGVNGSVAGDETTGYDEDAAGQHVKITFYESITAPTPVGSKSHLYMNGDELYYQDDTNTAKQITKEGQLNIVDADGAVLKAGAQTIADLKTFSTIPKIPTDDPTADAEVVSKVYMAAQLATISDSKIKVGTYSGDNAVTQAITGVGFQPDALMVLPHSGNNYMDVYVKTSAMGIYAKWMPSNTGWLADQIISLDADGFTVGDGSTYQNALNLSGITYSYIALKG